jgi:hypothetical protein
MGRPLAPFAGGAAGWAVDAARDSGRARSAAAGEGAAFLVGDALAPGPRAGGAGGGRPAVAGRAFALAGVGAVAGGGGGPPPVRDFPWLAALLALERLDDALLDGAPLVAVPLGTSGRDFGGDPEGTSGRPLALAGAPLGTSGRPRLGIETGTSGRPLLPRGTGAGSGRAGTAGGPGAVCCLERSGCNG